MNAMEDCQQTLKDLELFLDGELPADQREQVLEHLHECMECFHAYDLQAELKQVIAAKCADEPLPAGLLDRIKRSLSDETFDGKAEPFRRA
jgi:mycothiol system anti-sigma-R factor